MSQLTARMVVSARVRMGHGRCSPWCWIVC